MMRGVRPPDCYVCYLTLGDVPDDGRDYFTLVRFGARSPDHPHIADSARAGVLGAGIAAAYI
jgi:hypothetical protein